MRTEALVYDLAADRPELLMPRILHRDLSRTELPSDVLVVSHLDGALWGETPASELDIPSIERQLGAYMAYLHQITSTNFGYPNEEAGIQGATWAEAFTLMVTTLLDDAASWGTPVPADEVRAVLARNREVLDEVTTPHLVHADLWPGNVFLDVPSSTIVGIIDPERAFWGDPLFDFVGHDQFGRGPVPATILDGYASVSESLPIETAGGRTRLLLYRLYMSLVLAIEIAPRGYDGDWLASHQAAAEGNIRAALDALNA